MQHTVEHISKLCIFQLDYAFVILLLLLLQLIKILVTVHSLSPCLNGHIRKPSEALRHLGL